MSGKPHPEGVLRLRLAFNDRHAARLAEVRIRQVIEENKTALRIESEKREAAEAEIDEIMKEMDISSTGNFGYREHLIWTLDELSWLIREDVIASFQDRSES